MIYLNHFSENREQYDSTTTAHSKTIIKILKYIYPIFKNVITILYNKDGCYDQYICATLFYLLSMFTHLYNIIIGHDVRSPGHGKYFFMV